MPAHGSDVSPVIGTSPQSALRRWLRVHVIERSLRRLPKTGRVLDLCCGYGFYFDINPSAVGIDGDEGAIAHLKAAGRDVRLGNVLSRLPFSDASFDWVVAHDALEHFTWPELQHIFREVSRILSDRGAFLVFVPNRKGFDDGLRRGVGHKLFVRSDEIARLAEGEFYIEAAYPEPLPRPIGRWFTHNKEVFRLRKCADSRSGLDSGRRDVAQRD